MSTTEKPFRTVSSQIVWDCPWFRVRQDEIILPDGQSGSYNVIEKPDAVWIVPVTTDGRVVMIRQFRYTVDDHCWEVPAGSVKPDQSLEEAAREELREEVGGEADTLSYVGRFYPANGICNEMGHIFLALDITMGEPRHEAAEVIDIHLKPVADVLHMARSGQITDGPTALALLLCADKLLSLASPDAGLRAIPDAP
jgi:ADP-ribose pyrophosphatase